MTNPTIEALKTNAQAAEAAAMAADKALADARAAIPDLAHAAVAAHNERAQALATLTEALRNQA